MKNFERTGGQTAYSSAGTNQCWSVQTSAGVRKTMYLLRTRQLIHCVSRHNFGRPLCLEFILTASQVGKWPSFSFRAYNPSPEMMNTIHTVWTGKRLVTRAPSGGERTNTENSDLMSLIHRWWLHLTLQSYVLCLTGFQLTSSWSRSVVGAVDKFELTT